MSGKRTRPLKELFPDEWYALEAVGHKHGVDLRRSEIPPEFARQIARAYVYLLAKGPVRESEASDAISLKSGYVFWSKLRKNKALWSIFIATNDRNKKIDANPEILYEIAKHYCLFKGEEDYLIRQIDKMLESRESVFNLDEDDFIKAAPDLGGFGYYHYKKSQEFFTGCEDILQGILVVLDKTLSPVFEIGRDVFPIPHEDLDYGHSPYTLVAEDMWSQNRVSSLLLGTPDPIFRLESMLRLRAKLSAIEQKIIADIALIYQPTINPKAIVKPYSELLKLTPEERVNVIADYLSKSRHHVLQGDRLYTNKDGEIQGESIWPSIHAKLRFQYEASLQFLRDRERIFAEVTKRVEADAENLSKCLPRLDKMVGEAYGLPPRRPKHSEFKTSLKQKRG